MTDCYKPPHARRYRKLLKVNHYTHFRRSTRELGATHAQSAVVGFKSLRRAALRRAAVSRLFSAQITDLNLNLRVRHDR